MASWTKRVRADTARAAAVAPARFAALPADVLLLIAEFGDLPSLNRHWRGVAREAPLHARCPAYATARTAWWAALARAMRAGRRLYSFIGDVYVLVETAAFARLLTRSPRIIDGPPPMRAPPDLRRLVMSVGRHARRGPVQHWQPALTAVVRDCPLLTAVVVPRPFAHGEWLALLAARGGSLNGYAPAVCPNCAPRAARPPGFLPQRVRVGSAAAADVEAGARTNKAYDALRKGLASMGPILNDQAVMTALLSDCDALSPAALAEPIPFHWEDLMRAGNGVIEERIRAPLAPPAVNVAAVKAAAMELRIVPLAAVSWTAEDSHKPPKLSECCILRRTAPRPPLLCADAPRGARTRRICRVSFSRTEKGVPPRRQRQNPLGLKRPSGVRVADHRRSGEARPRRVSFFFFFFFNMHTNTPSKGTSARGGSHPPAPPE